MPDFICPVCSRQLNIIDRSYRCENGHNFDMAKSGYVNLLPPSPAGKRHGDDKLMVKARTAFLNKGFYDPLSNKIADLVCEHTGPAVELIDAGCGEGKYTFDVFDKLQKAGKTVRAAGVDISSAALIQASKRSRDIKYCAASIAKMPFQSECADVVLNIFSPFFESEYARVLKKGGLLVRAIPLERHLWELKELIYDKSYENTLPNLDLEQFSLLERHDVCYSFELESQEDIMALFMMTPYYYKTSKEDQLKAQQADRLSVGAQFSVLVYKKF